MKINIPINLPIILGNAIIYSFPITYSELSEAPKNILIILPKENGITLRSEDVCTAVYAVLGITPDLLEGYFDKLDGSEGVTIYKEGSPTVIITSRRYPIWDEAYVLVHELVHASNIICSYVIDSNDETQATICGDIFKRLLNGLKLQPVEWRELNK